MASTNHSPIPSLPSLGRRIMIMGPTNAGKSTLAVALAVKLGIPAMHVDLFRHLPYSDWQQRPDAEFEALHDAAIAQPEWVMEGNYSKLLPQRITRATGIVVLDDRLWRRYWRYFRRTLNTAPRAGGLEGGQDSIKWEMIRWLWHTRKSSSKSRDRAQSSGLPYVFAHDQGELQALYRAWGLTQPPA